MKLNTDLFKIKSNNVTPSRGKLLISEPFLRDSTFGRSVILLVDHTKEGSMGLVMNKKLPFNLNYAIKEFKNIKDIPLYTGGPLSSDILFFIHTLSHIPEALPICKNLYLNGDFEMIKAYILQGNPIDGHIRFFLGYSGWENDQLNREIEENTWIIGKGKAPELLDRNIENMWKNSLSRLGTKYETWSRFPQIPSLN